MWNWTLKYQLLWLLILLVPPPPTTSLPQQIPDDTIIIPNKIKNNVVDLVSKAWDKIKQQSPPPNLETIATTLSPILTEINKLEKQLISYEYNEALKSLSKIKTTSTNWNEISSEVSILSSPIEILYAHFKIFTSNPSSFTPTSSPSSFDFNTDTLSSMILKPLYTQNQKITLSYMAESIHSAIVRKSQTQQPNDAYKTLNTHIEESLAQSYWCLWNSKTPQMVVYGFYANTVAIDIKTYALINFAWMLSYSINGTNTSQSTLESLTSELHGRVQQKTTAAKSALAISSSSYWKCDGVEYKKGENYDEFVELLQGYIENEKNMHHAGSCRQSCSEYNVVKAYCEYPDPGTCHSHKVCMGDLVECKFVASDANVCVGGGGRRFDWVQYKKGPTYGDTSGKCNQHTERRDSFWRFLYHCSNCFCLCDDPTSPTTTRHISLLPVLSDTDANKIVTGVKFTMKNGVLYLQIQEGEATRNGGVVPESVSWKEIVEADKGSRNETFVMSYTARGLDLDDLVVGGSHVVTGVRFRVLGGHVNLEIRGTQINPDTGGLLRGSSYWVSNDNTPEGGRVELVLEDPDVPIRSVHPSVPDSVHDQFVSFGVSSLVKDVGQSTVPFLDVQGVSVSPSVWVRGVGVYHKGQVGYGGFVGVRVFTIGLDGFL